MEKILQGKVALVTGGTAGIGKAIAKKYLEHGAKVIIFGTQEEKGKQAALDLHHQTGLPHIEFFRVNVADFQAVREVIEQVLGKYGNVDILVNNAGITRDQLMMRMKEQDWDDVMSVNAKSCFNVTQALLRTMIKARSGKIINISSVVGIIGNPGQANYAASKAAMIGFTRSIAKEIASRNICVNCIAPGFIQTDMTDVLSDAQKEEIMRLTPMGRIGKPEDIANVALFLASPSSDFITGQVITVDGGMVMGG